MPLERIVVISDFGTVVGGAAKVAIASSRGLALAGFAVDFFCGVGPLAPDLHTSGVATHCLDQSDILNDANRLHAALSGLWNRTAASRLKTLLAGCDPEKTIVHVHSWTKCLSPSVIRAISASGVPLVVTIHDYFTACPNGGFFDYPRLSICDRRALSAKCVVSNCDARNYGHKAWRVARQLISARVAGVPRSLNSIIYVSDLSKRVLQSYFSTDARWFKVGYPVDVERTDRVPAEENRDFIFVGRLTPEKGVCLFAEAAARAGVSALIVGDGTERGRIERSWPQVRIVGWVSTSRVQELMRSARALVFPSLWYEGQPLVVLEALASGLPVLVGDHNGSRESVSDNVTGLVFPQGNIEALAAAMRRMIDRDMVRSMSHAAYDAYWSHPLDLARHCTALVDVYNEILDRNRTVRSRSVQNAT